MAREGFEKVYIYCNIYIQIKASNMKKIYETEASLKYLLYIIILLIGFLIFGFVQIAPKIGGGLSILFAIPYLTMILPYLPSLILLTICWDIMAEEKRVHKIFGSILLIIALAFMAYIWMKIGFPVPSSV